MTVQALRDVPQSCLDVLDVMKTMIQRAKKGLLKPQDNKHFIHGMTWREVERTFGHAKQYTLGEYANRQRDLYHPFGLAGKHFVHGEIHYFPLDIEVDHSKCSQCSLEVPSK